MARRELTVLTNQQANTSEEQDACHELNGHGNGSCGQRHERPPRRNCCSLGVLANGCGS